VTFEISPESIERFEKEQRENRALWSMLVAQKYRGKNRLPAFMDTCSMCFVLRACFLVESQPVCFNCAILNNMAVRRAFTNSRKNTKVVDCVGGWGLPAWQWGDIVLDEDLPKGQYYFHYTTSKSLKQISKIGLIPYGPLDRGHWRHPPEYESELRLYLYPNIEHGLYNARDTGILLRFRRSIMKTEPKWFDDGYGGNVFSIILRSGKVPTQRLEVAWIEKYTWEKDVRWHSLK